MAAKFTIPGTTYIGDGALVAAGSDICALGTKALIVTGQSMIKQGFMKVLTDILGQNGVGYVIDSKISGEPTDVMIEEGLLMYQENACDFIIGFGGGSPLDSAKAIGAMVTNPGKISDYNGKVIQNPIPPLAAIPSTAGTGSEVTQFTIISDTKNQIKMLLKGSVLLPDIAVVDPQFTMSTPKSVTAATGLDALTHAVEAYTSKKATAQTDLYAVSAVKKIFTYLPRVYADGICINNSSVTIVHGMSRPIGALFHVPHGLSNAMLLKDCLEFAADGTYERFATLGRAVGRAESSDSDETAAKKFIEALGEICKICEVPTLEEYGVDREEFFKVIGKMAQDAYDSGSPGNTRKAVTIEDMEMIYRKLWEK